MTQSIMEYVYHSHTINSAFTRFIKSEEIHEFKQHIYLELLQMKGGKLQRAYEGGYIDFLVYRIMKNQYKSDTSPWASKVREETNESIDNLSNLEYEEYQPSEQININRLKSDIETLLESRNWDKNNFLLKQYHNQLFRMYYFDNLSYQKIEKLTGVNYQSVRISVLQTFDYIKQNISPNDYIYIG